MLKLEEKRVAGGPDSRRGRGGPLAIVGIVGVLALVGIATSGGGFGGIGGTRDEVEATTVPPDPDDGPAVTVPAVADIPGKVLINLGGAGSTRTKDFTVGDTWEIAWAYDCAVPVPATRSFSVAVRGLEGVPAPVIRDAVRDEGVARVTTAGGGTAYLEINSGCTWSVKVLG